MLTALEGAKNTPSPIQQGLSGLEVHGSHPLPLPMVRCWGLVVYAGLFQLQSSLGIMCAIRQERGMFVGPKTSDTESIFPRFFFCQKNLD